MKSNIAVEIQLIGEKELRNLKVPEENYAYFMIIALDEFKTLYYLLNIKVASRCLSLFKNNAISFRIRKEH
jgi:hypothetical protein